MKTFLGSLVLSLALTACSPAGSLPTAPISGAFPTDEEIEVRGVVEGFGRTLQNVSLLSPTASDDIAAQYTPYVAPDLLQQWVADPESAPGRLTSSPWPDHIEIVAVERQSEGVYLASGFVVEITSDGSEAARYPVAITVSNFDGLWLITAFERLGGYQ